LNAICPYFTMFPIAFPLRVLQTRAAPGEWVLDPFAGRGTTNYAARVLGLPSIGIDSSPVAVALTSAKLANTTPRRILQCAEEILSTAPVAPDVPAGEFWSLAYHADVLRELCTVRDALRADCRSDARRALRGILLGALHGPRTKKAVSHLSNQCVRTYAPKPRYAVGYWKSRSLEPPAVDIREVIRVRAERYYSGQRRATGTVVAGDSRKTSTFGKVESRVHYTITSPPYYGMRTYVPDQWLRNWFVGGSCEVDYTTARQLDHPSPSAFAAQLRSVWRNVASVSADSACMVVRFGGIGDRAADPLEILKESIRDSPWRLQTVVPAGSAETGRRQAEQFAGKRVTARAEFDCWARLE
jgi:hypothetical protein